MTGWLIWIAVLLPLGALLHRFEERLAETPRERPERAHHGAAARR